MNSDDPFPPLVRKNTLQIPFWKHQGWHNLPLLLRATSKQLGWYQTNGVFGWISGDYHQGGGISLQKKHGRNKHLPGDTKIACVGRCKFWIFWKIYSYWKFLGTCSSATLWMFTSGVCLLKDDILRRGSVGWSRWQWKWSGRWSHPSLAMKISASEMYIIYMYTCTYMGDIYTV